MVRSTAGCPGARDALDAHLASRPILAEIVGTAAYGRQLAERARVGDTINVSGCGSLRAWRFAQAGLEARSLRLTGSRYGGVVDYAGQWIAIGPRFYDAVLDAAFEAYGPYSMGHLDPNNTRINGYSIRVVDTIPMGQIARLRSDRGRVEMSPAVSADDLPPDQTRATALHVLRDLTVHLENVSYGRDRQGLTRVRDFIDYRPGDRIPCPDYRRNAW